MRTQDQFTIRLYVKAREDFQAMRKSMDNRLGRKADGSAQQLKEERSYTVEDVENFNTISLEARRNEKAIERMLQQALKRFPVYNLFLSKVKGLGEIAAGWILAEFDIVEADTVSKMWQYAGLNPGMVRGKKRVPAKEYKPEMGEQVAVVLDDKGTPEAYIVRTDQIIRGDRPTPGFILPYNKRLRTALIGVFADSLIKAKKTCAACKSLDKDSRPAPNCSCERSPYAVNFYYPYKARLEQEANPVQSIGNRDEGKSWRDVSKGHRDNAAKRYMVKMFLRDLYVAWRTIEGLPVRPPYAEEYLGRKHHG